METVLVTGGCGLIGQHIVSGLLKKGFAVIAVDTHDNGYNDNKLHYTFVPADITDKDVIGELFEQNEIDIFVHAACTVDNDLEPIVTEKQIKDSAAADKFIYRYAMTSAKVRKIVLLSTDQVYDFPKTREPIREHNELKINSNYAALKYASEKALIKEMAHHKDIICCVLRFSPVYTLNYTDNLMSKIIDPKDGSLFVAGKGQYGFQFCCVHNLVDFILCFAQNADDMSYAGTYNVSDKLLITAADIISFMREHHSLGAVVSKTPSAAMSKLKGLFGNKEEKQNYRYLDLSKLENNNMLDNTKASKLLSFRWDIHNTK
jgi:UDP-glucose 4-epimerase